jgi:hypothetical protein
MGRASFMIRLSLSLEKLAKQGAKAMVGNKGFARFLKVAKGSVSIDAEAVKRQVRPDHQHRAVDGGGGPDL